MFRPPESVWLAIPVVVAIAGILAANAAEPTAAPVPQPAIRPVTTDPNDPTKKRAIVPLAEREALGLAPHTWSGVMHPDVYPKLEEINATIATLKKRLREEKDVEAFGMLGAIPFKGTVYVQVRVKDMDARRRVLRNLSAAEFRQPMLFENTPGLTGYATKSALGKLAASSDVVAVCLDQQPLPEKPRTVYRDDLPPRKPGAFEDAPGVAEGRVDLAVHHALNLNVRVDVAVSLSADALPRTDDLPADPQKRNEIRDQAEKQLRERILSRISADAFAVWVEHGTGISGFVTKQGIEELLEFPEVIRIGLKQIERPAATRTGTRSRAGNRRSSCRSSEAPAPTRLPAMTQNRGTRDARDARAYVLITPRLSSSNDAMEQIGGEVDLEAVLDRVVGSVSADQLDVGYRLSGRPGVFAHVTSSGLQSLAMCGDEITTRTSTIEPEVHRKLKESDGGYVSVIILLADVGHKDLQLQARDALVRAAQMSLLARLEPLGFRRGARFEGIEAVVGQANDRSLDLLAFDADVAGVNYNAPIELYSLQTHDEPVP